MQCKDTITKETSYKIGSLEPGCLIEVLAHGTALTFELFDDNKQQTIQIFSPTTPNYSFTVPYKSDWKLIVKINGILMTPTEFELKVV